EEGLDTGPVYGTLTEVIGPQDTAGDLLSRLAQAGAGLLVSTLDGIADGQLSPVPQPRDGVSYAAKLTAEDAHVDFAAPAFAVHRQIRAMTPAPGAWVHFRDQRLSLGPPRLTDVNGLAPHERDPGELSPGEIQAGKREVLVGTATGAIRLGEVTTPGKRAVPAADWARGARLKLGERFR
ncbi:MAG: methionyl-tRNA formyltransferase, partial [Actinomycetes bacterium]